MANNPPNLDFSSLNTNGNEITETRVFANPQRSLSKTPYSKPFSLPYNILAPSVYPSPRKREELLSPRSASNQSFWTGVALLIFISIYFLFNLTTMWGSKTFLGQSILAIFLPTSLVDFLANDHHYCYLIPTIGPVIFIFALFNWMGMKFFRHNA
jgi:hypothetical protein